MSTRSNMLMLGVTGLLIAALPILAKTTHKIKPKTKPNAVPVETAVIVNTGSTNTTGYRVTVSSDRTATESGDQAPHTISKAMADKFFQDLHAAQPLSSLPVRHGPRSASFGTATYITYKGQQSPDLTSGGDARADALKSDIEAVTNALHVGNTPRRPLLRPMAP